MLTPCAHSPRRSAPSPRGAGGPGSQVARTRAPAQQPSRRHAPREEASAGHPDGTLRGEQLELRSLDPAALEHPLRGQAGPPRLGCGCADPWAALAAEARGSVPFRLRYLSPTLACEEVIFLKVTFLRPKNQCGSKAS